MEIFNRTNAPRYIREGIVGHLLVSPRTCEAKQLATSFVEIASGGRQRIHRHESEQVYFIIEGSGTMTVGEEQSKVETGDCIFVPSNVPHGLKNVGDSPLRYLGVVSPAFTDEQLQDYWPDAAESEWE